MTDVASLLQNHVETAPLPKKPVCIVVTWYEDPVGPNQRACIN